MLLTQGDQPIQTFPSKGPDQSFAERIGLQAPHRCLDDLKAEVPCRRIANGRKNRVVIMEHKPVGVVGWNGLA